MTATAIYPSLRHSQGGWSRYTAPEEQRPTASTMLVLACLAGTGGYADGHYWQHRQEMGYLPVTIHVLGHAGNNPQLVLGSPVEQLTLVRDVIKPVMTDLAAMFGVTRQALYSWASGEKQPSAEHAAKLDDLATAAKRLADAGFAGSVVGKRKIGEGKTLVQLVQAGGSASEAANRLIATLRNEAAQRNRMAARLAGRKPVSSVEDIGAPMLNERT